MEDNEAFEQSSFHRHVENYIVQLKDTKPDDHYGFQNQDRAARMLSKNIIYGEPSEGTYILNKLLQLIDQAPEDVDEDSDEDAFLRAGAIKAVVEVYLENKKVNNIPTDKIIDTIITRRQKLNKAPDYTMQLANEFIYSNVEVQEINRAFTKIVYYENSPRTLIKVFQCMMDGYGVMDLSSASSEHDLMSRMIKNAVESDKKLFFEYIDIIARKEEEFDYTNEFDYKSQYNISALYNTIFSMYWHLSFRERARTNEKLFKNIINIVKTHPDEGIRSQYIDVLGRILNRETEMNPALLEQQYEMESEIMTALTKVIQDHPESKASYLGDTASYKAYSLLSKMVERYTKASIYNKESKSYQKIQERYQEEYDLAFDILVNNISTNPKLRSEQLQMLNKFLNPEYLENSDHPFLSKGRKFLFEYYKKLLQED